MARRAALVALLAAFLSVAGAGPCTWTDPSSGATFDLTPAVRSGGNSYVLSKEADIYIANVCENAEAKCEKSGKPSEPGVAFQFRSGVCTARMASADAPAFALLDASDPGKGIRITYPGGDVCEAHPQHIPRQVVYEMQCTPGGETAIVGEDEGGGDQICHYTLRWNSPAACPVSGSGSWGFTVLLYGFVGVVVYLVVGIAYNVKFRGATGAEAIPNMGFWRQLPGLVKDGVTYSVEKANSFMGKGSSGNPYESI